MAVVNVLAALFAALAVAWAVPGGDSLSRLREPSRRRARRRPARGFAGAALALGALLVAAAVLCGPAGAAVALALSLVVATAGAVGRQRAVRASWARGQLAVVRAGEVIAGLLRVGRVPDVALVEASRDAPVLAVAAAEVQAGGDAAAALRRTARGAGHAGLGELAAAWEVAHRTGASLVVAVDAAAARLAADQDVARVVDAELAAVRLGGRVMAVLPLVGVGLAVALGGDPLGFLTGSPAGWVALDVGVGLGCAGVLWIETVATRAGAR